MALEATQRLRSSWNSCTVKPYFLHVSSTLGASVDEVAVHAGVVAVAMVLWMRLSVVCLVKALSVGGRTECSSILSRHRLEELRKGGWCWDHPSCLAAAVRPAPSQCGGRDLSAWSWPNRRTPAVLGWGSMRLP